MGHAEDDESGILDDISQLGNGNEIFGKRHPRQVSRVGVFLVHQFGELSPTFNLK